MTAPAAGGADFANAEIGQLLDDVVSACSRGDYAEEVVRAKAEFFERCGQVFEDDQIYEARMAAFLEWYAVERPIGTGVPGVGRVPADIVRDDAGAGDVRRRQLLTAMAASHRSLFRLEEVRAASLIATDLIAGGLWEVSERRKIAGLGDEDVFEARLYGVDGHVVLGRTFLIHERVARPAVLEIAARAAAALAGGDGAARVRAVERLASLRIKADRYRNVPAHRFYAQEARR